MRSRFPRGCHAIFPNLDYSSVKVAEVKPKANVMMAFQQAANKGTLVPGQSIAVNKYTVQVERYLSQGLIPFNF